SWDDWEGSDEYNFGPDGEFVSMSTMDVGWWNSDPSSSTRPPLPRAPTPPPADMANEQHFVSRIIRHYRYIAVLDAVKVRLNQYFEEPPAGYESEFFLEEMHVWKEFAEMADKMKGDLRITGQPPGKVSYMDGIQLECKTVSLYDFAAMMKSHDEQVVRDMTAFVEHYIDFFKLFSENEDIRLDYVLEAV
ncbi:hypothetical protein PENTCL1PPCAC_29710, partial [Pristionchus entomophagus]